MKKKSVPKISIVMGIYNCAEYLSESIESIINQTYTNWELIMCDDGSKDNTLKIAKEYEQKYPEKIKVLVNEKNMGLNYTLNKCIENATGEYIARQDGDDVSLPTRFEKEIEFLEENKDYSLVSSNMIFFDESGDWGVSHNSGEVKKENFVKGSPICHAPCMIRTKDLRSVGCYSVDEKLLRVEDYHLWFKLFIAGYKCYNLEESLYKMRDDENAYKRRNLKNRINETRLKLWGFKKINIKLKDYVWAFKPIIAYILPKSIYQKFHKKNLENSKKKLSKIKIAQFVGLMDCGGTETMLMNVFEKIDKNKYEFIFIENKPNKSWYTDKITNLGGKIVKISEFRMKNFFSYIEELTNVLKREKIDVIHSHVFLHSGIVMYCAKKAGITTRISHSHSAMRKQDNNFFKKNILRLFINKYSTQRVACSTEAGICLYGNDFKKEGLVLPNPIDLAKFQVDDKTLNKLKNQYKLNNKTLVIGHVGRLVEIKNHEFMLKIAKKLVKEKVNFKMFFIGDGPLKEELNKEVKKLNLENNIIFTGNISNVNEYMKIFDILLLPSFYEGLPVTLVEAQASGLFSLVSSNVSRESDMGLNLIEFIDINDENVWVEKIMNFTKKEVSYSKIKKVMEDKKYDISKTICEYETLYNVGDNNAKNKN